MTDQTAAEHELRLVIGQFEDFAQRVSEGLHEGDWTTRREIIRALVKRIEIGPENIRVVYKVAPVPFAEAPDSGGRLQDCWRRELHTVGGRLRRIGGTHYPYVAGQGDLANVFLRNDPQQAALDQGDGSRVCNSQDLV